MTWALLLTLLFGTSLDEDYLVSQKASNFVNQNISDPSVKTKILEEIKFYRVERKKLNRQARGAQKEIQKNFARREVSREELRDKYADYLEIKKTKINNYVQLVLDVREITSESDWKLILDDIEKEHEAHLDQQDADLLNIRKTNDRVKRNFYKKIKDIDKRQQVSMIMHDFTEKELASTESIKNFSSASTFSERIPDNMDSFVALEKEVETIWWEFFERNTDVREKVSQLVTDKEWKVVKKASKKLFK